MLAYDTVSKEAGAIDVMAPFQQIEMLLTSYFKVITNPDKKKHKNPANPAGPTKQEVDQRLPFIADV